MRSFIKNRMNAFSLKFSLTNYNIFDTISNVIVRRGIVQLVERRSPKPDVEGSSPFAPVM